MKESRHEGQSRNAENATFEERPPERREEKAEPAKNTNELKQTLQTRNRMKKALVLGRRSADSAENWPSVLLAENKGFVGDKPQAKTVLRIAQNGL